MAFSDYIIYVDESGDHSLSAIDPEYPVFVLDFCMFRKQEYSTLVSPRVQNLKFKYFGHDAVVLHEYEIRKQAPPFSFLKSEPRRREFMADLTALIEEAPFTCIAAVIDKVRLGEKYERPDNPYDTALCFCIERAYAFLLEQGQAAALTHIVVERRGKREDAELELAFRRIIGGANRWQTSQG